MKCLRKCGVSLESKAEVRCDAISDGGCPYHVRFLEDRNRNHPKLKLPTPCPVPSISLNPLSLSLSPPAPALHPALYPPLLALAILGIGLSTGLARSVEFLCCGLAESGELSAESGRERVPNPRECDIGRGRGMGMGCGGIVNVIPCARLGPEEDVESE